MSRKRSPYARPDHRTRAAKAQGYAARSVFKLSEIDARVRLLKYGHKVLDLGAAPGSWSQYASEKTGLAGRILAVDLKPITEPLGTNVVVVQGDALSLQNADLERFAPYDVVLSDMAPSTTGSTFRDQMLSAELFHRAVDVALVLGAPGSAFVGKLFMSEELTGAKKRLVEAYERVQLIRPQGTRKISSELFLVALGQRSH